LSSLPFGYAVSTPRMVAAMDQGILFSQSDLYRNATKPSARRARAVADLSTGTRPGARIRRRRHFGLSQPTLRARSGKRGFKFHAAMRPRTPNMERLGTYGHPKRLAAPGFPSVSRSHS